MSDPRMIGHYRIGQLLGEGSMGKVHLAVDTLIDREVAIKFLRPALTQDQEIVSRFRLEASNQALLNHPNIATLYAALPDGPGFCLVMELVRGPSLDAILVERGRALPLDQSLAIIAQIADGLSYAHQMRVIHRDIKPSNLMIASDGRVKIMDFGIARLQGSERLTRDGTAIGTPLYMAPEQSMGEGTVLSDLYSLALVFYEMLSGSPPFSGTEYELWQAHLHADPPSLVPRVPGVTRELETAIMTALSKNPEYRFPTARAFSDAVGATAFRNDAQYIIGDANNLIHSNTYNLNPMNTPKTVGIEGSNAAAHSLAKASTTFKRLPSTLWHVALVGGLALIVLAAFLAIGPLLDLIKTDASVKAEKPISDPPEKLEQLEADRARVKLLAEQVRREHEKQQNSDVPQELQRLLEAKEKANGEELEQLEEEIRELNRRQVLELAAQKRK